MEMTDRIEMGRRPGQVASARRRQRAASLIEVMVVMVVLLIGIFAVVRLYPVGFQYMRNAENRTLATRLAHQSTEQAEADAANLPERITFSFYYRDSGGQLRRATIAGYDPDFDVSGALDSADSQLEGNPYYRDVNLYRFVEAEPVKVPLPTAAGDVTGSVYTVRNGPIFMDPTTGDPEAAPATDDERAVFESYLKVSGAPLAGSSVDSNNGRIPPVNFRGQLRGAQSYVIDYGFDEATPGRIAFPASSRARTYILRYLYETDGAVRSAVDIRVTAPSGQPSWILLPHAGVLPGSETVRRLFERIPLSAGWDSEDPYQFKLRYSNVPRSSVATELSSANIGMLLFNPAGATFAEQGVAGQTRPFTAYVDYTVLDWHILHDDREVPSVIPGAAGDVPVRLTLSKIKAIGDTNADNSIYEGLYPAGETNSDDNSDIQVFRLDTGQPLAAGDYATKAPDADYWIDNGGREGTYSTGTLYINTNRVPQGTPIRILYKGDGDWAVALQKAAAFYKAALTDTGDYRLRPPVEQMDLDADPTTAPMPVGDPSVFGIEGTRLYFTRSELNKSVVATLEYFQGNGRRVRTQPQQLTINEADGLYAYAEVGSLMPGRDTGRAWRVVGDIQGVSVKTRVIWKDEVSRRARWRVQDMDTYLTRSALR